MINQYGTHVYDWMGQEITAENPLTFHHIIKNEYKGSHGIENGALLTVNSHRRLHYFEKSYPKLYKEYTDLFIEINDKNRLLETEEIEKIKELKLKVKDRKKLYTKPTQLYTEATQKLMPLAKKMINIYGFPKYDWMGYPISDENRIGLEKLRGNNYTLGNVAIIGGASKNKLITMQTRFPEFYELYIDLFEMINASKKPLTPKIIQKIIEMQIELEEILCNCDSNELILELNHKK